MDGMERHEDGGGTTTRAKGKGTRMTYRQRCGGERRGGGCVDLVALLREGGLVFAGLDHVEMVARLALLNDGLAILAADYTETVEHEPILVV